VKPNADEPEPNKGNREYARINANKKYSRSLALIRGLKNVCRKSKDLTLK
jgi:hypothetical protein